MIRTKPYPLADKDCEMWLKGPNNKLQVRIRSEYFKFKCSFNKNGPLLCPPPAARGLVKMANNNGESGPFLLPRYSVKCDYWLQ